MIVPFAAGGGTDAVARVVVEHMSGLIGQPIIIENVVGADGSIGLGRGALARPDGYTIVFGLLDTNVLNGAFYSLRYDVLNDFAPVMPLVINPITLFARKNLPANDLRDKSCPPPPRPRSIRKRDVELLARMGSASRRLTEQARRDGLGPHPALTRRLPRSYRIVAPWPSHLNSALNRSAGATSSPTRSPPTSSPLFA
jgi:hypothetical protein